ncbi:MAG: cation diffusion facilitator family transporter [Spirochaetes bacterium]|nr:cation diffusion facilitator family transporter [Spirochaetota bacterium]
MLDRSTMLRRASVIAISGNAILAFAKITVGIVAGSLAVVSDGVDSSTDVAIAFMTLVAARVAFKPGDREHPYGHSRAETVATALLAFIVFFAGSQLLLAAAGGLLSGERPEMPGTIAVWVTMVSILGKLALAWSQFHYGKLAKSGMLVANGKNMQGDVVTSIAVLVGLGASFGLGLPVLDRVLALLVSLWIIKNAIGIFLEANTELMDGTSDHGPYAEVFGAIATVRAAGNPHRTRIRRLGSFLIVDTDIEVAPDITVSAAHVIAIEVEQAIKDRLPEVYDVIVHVEPVGNLEDDERYGLTPGDGEGDAVAVKTAPGSEAGRDA